MRGFQLILLIPLVLATVAAQQATGSPGNQASGFKPVSAEGLKKEAPKPGWMKAKTIKFWESPGQPQATIHLFLAPFSEDSKNDNSQKDFRKVDAFLEQQGELRRIGYVGSFGVSGQGFVETHDVTGDETNEILVSGSLGAGTVALEVLKFGDDHRWTRSLSVSCANYEIRDINNDGVGEIVTRDLPKQTTFRWRDGAFQARGHIIVTGETFNQTSAPY